jgi:potassium-transporting ATPase KdpC subunit
MNGRSGMKRMLAEILVSLRATAALAILLCGVYPLMLWGLAQGIFPGKANGSMVVRDGRIVGSRLIGRPFAGPTWFHPRPSAAGAGYDATASGGSNLGPLSRRLVEETARRASEYRIENGLPPDALVPADAVTASGSGLDPHISVANALLQAGRVARARGMSEADVRGLIERATEERDLGCLGERRVNVLVLNAALDDLSRRGGDGAAPATDVIHHG